MPPWKTIVAILAVLAPATVNFFVARSAADENRIRAEVAYKAQVDANAALLVKVERLEDRVAGIKAQFGVYERALGITLQAPMVHPAPRALKAVVPFEKAVEQFKAEERASEK
ncbi:MAG: hypothetical protein WC986_14815 [Elusimicrobiota bacterium]|jgi:hypothetical protein